MLRIMTYSEANRILGSSLSPNDYCICKKTALANHANPAPFNTGGKFEAWTNNRLVVVDPEIDILRFTITWNFGGNGTSDKIVQNVPYGTSISSSTAGKPANPTWTGHTFLGWYIENTPLEDQTVSQNTTVTAHWREDIVYYTVRFLKSDGTTEAYSSVQYAEGSKIAYPGSGTSTDNYGQGVESDNYAATLVNPDPDMLYAPSGWGLSTDTNKKLGTQIKYAKGEYAVNGIITFISTFNSDTRNDGNIKIFDQIGQLFNTTKETPTHPSSGINKHDIYSFIVGKTGWYSMVHDGHSASGSNPDVLGSDKGISPSETERKRVYTSASDRHNVGGFYAYTGDSIIYEPFEITQNYTADHVISGFKTAESSVTSDDLLTEITFKDSNDNVVLHIKSLDPTWLKFAIIDVRGSYTNSKFLDTAAYDPATYTEKLYPAQDANTLQVENIPLQAEIFYYIADNDTNARCGEIEVETPQGGDCSYVTNQSNTVFDNTNNKYMTKGTVYFYQLGPNYTGKP